MSRVIIPAACIEYEEGGNTIWVQGPQGGTLLRIQVSRGNKVTSTQCATSPIAHADIQVEGDVVMCLPRARRR